MIGTFPQVIRRVRLRLSRIGEAAQMSHLQQIEMMRSALKNCAWPVAMSGAKKKKPKMSFGPAISVGYESEAEYVDVDLTGRLDVSKAAEVLNPHLSKGYSLLSIKSIPRFFPSLEETLNFAIYEVQSPLLDGTSEKWDDFWRKEEFVVTKKKADREEKIDARALVETWKLDGQKLVLRLRFGPKRTLKPERIIQAVCGWDETQARVGVPGSNLRIRRAQLLFERNDGQQTEP